MSTKRQFAVSLPIFHIERVLLCSVLFLTVVTSSVAQEQAVYDAQAEALFNKALGAYESGNYGQASVQFDAVAKRKPVHQKSTAAYLMGAKAHMRANNPQAAIELLTPFFIQFPSSKYQGDAIILYADAQTAAGKYMDAFRSYSVGLTVVTDRDQREDLLYHMQIMLERARPNRSQFDALLRKVDDEVARAEIASLWSKLDFEDTRPPQQRKPAARQQTPKQSTRRTNPRLVMVFPKEPPTDVHQEIINEVVNGIMTAVEYERYQTGCRVDTALYYVSTLDSLRMYVRALQDEPAVIGIVGGAFSDDARMLVKATAGTDIPVILPTATADDLVSGQEVFQLNVPFDVRGKMIARYVRNTLKARTVAILAPLRSFARTIAEAFKNEAQRLGLMVDIVSWYRPGTDDMSRQFNTLRTRQFGDSIDVLFAPVQQPADIAPILDGVVSTNITKFVLGAGDWAYPDTIAAHIGPGMKVEFATEYCVDSTGEAYSAFKTQYLGQYNAKPSKHAVFGYDAARMLLRSLCANPDDRQTVFSEMYEPYEGLHSTISLSQQRQNTSLTIMQYKGRTLRKKMSIQENDE